MIVQNYELLLNYLAHAIRTGELEAGTSLNSLKLNSKSLEDIFDLIRNELKINTVTVKLQDFVIYYKSGLSELAGETVNKEKIIAVYVQNIGEIETKCLLDLDNSLYTEMLNKYPNELTDVSYIDLSSLDLSSVIQIDDISNNEIV